MYIAGKWLLCSDGITRPVILGEMRAANGTWVEVPFLIDSGADCTTLSAQVYRRLGEQPLVALHPLAGVGGTVPSIVFRSIIYLTRETGGRAPVRGQYAAVTELEALDMSVLGRDVTDLFALIIDRPGNTVCLVNQNHRYTISSS